MVEIKEAKLFQGLPESELRSLEKQMKTVKHAAGHEIVVKGENGVGFMIILDGTVTVSTVQGKSRKLGPDHKSRQRLPEFSLELRRHRLQFHRQRTKGSKQYA